MGFFENAKNGGNDVVSPADEAQRILIMERRVERIQKSVTREYARKMGKVGSSRKACAINERFTAQASACAVNL